MSEENKPQNDKPRFVGEWVRLGDVLEKTFSGEWGVEEGELLTPVLRTSNFNEDGTFDYETPAMRCIPAKKIEAKRMLRGDIVLEKSGGTPKRPVGIMAYYDSDDLALCSNFNQVLRFDKGVVDSKYAFYQLRWLKERGAFRQFTRKTTGLQNLQMKKFVDLKLLRPPLEEQKKISSQFDAIAAQIAHAEVQIEKFDQLVKSRFVEMFDAVERYECLGDLGLIVTGNTPSKKNASYYEGRDIPFFKPGDFAGSKVSRLVSSANYISNEAKETARILPKDSVLVTCIGTIGKVGVLAEEAAFNQQINGIVPYKTKCLSRYLAQAILLNANSLIDASNAVTVAIVNKSTFSKMVVPVPPLCVQQGFCDFARSVDKPRFAIQQQIEKLEMLKASLMQEYFG